MSASPACYATLAQLRERNKIEASDGTDDSRLLSKLRAATASITRLTGRSFVPFVETRAFDWKSATYVEFANSDALVVTAIVDGFNRTINTSAITLLGGTSLTKGPFYAAQLNPVYDYMFLLFIKERAITVTGTWGYHDDYPNSAWHSSADAVSNALAALATDNTLTVSGVSGPDEWGIHPRFSPGQLISVDSEYMNVNAVTGTTLTVSRAVNGTALATHSTNAPIQIYTPMPDIVEIACRWAALLGQQDDAGFGQTFIPALGTIVPAGLPPDMVQMLMNLKRLRVA